MRFRAYWSVQLTVFDEEEQKNGQPDEGVCDVQHTVHSDELFVIRQHKRNGQPDQGVCDIRHAVHSDELFALRHENRNGSNEQDVCDTRQTGL